MSLLLQLNGDLPDRFAGHERRLYLWTCRKKACRRKPGSVRAFRATRVDISQSNKVDNVTHSESDAAGRERSSTIATNIGEAIFGVSQSNPFALPLGGGSKTSGNPFASPRSPDNNSSHQSPVVDQLPETFAQKARIGAVHTLNPDSTSAVPYEPWPEPSAFPDSFPKYHLDADTEYLTHEPLNTPSHVRLDRNTNDDEGGSSSSDNRALFESSMDKTFQRFADRLEQNPEQVLRYEFNGQPLLYSRKDDVGKLLTFAQENDKSKVHVGSGAEGQQSISRLPKCENCGAGRVFELQLTPHAITELEMGQVSIDGMDWGSIILCVCSMDCLERNRQHGEIGYVEEWVGVQWEELADHPRG